MKQVVTSSEMKSLDLLASKKFMIPLVLLMENAGREIKRYIIEYIKNNKIQNSKILIVAGPGNNGGDGFVCARHILTSLDKVSILLLILTERNYKGDAVESTLSRIGIREVNYNIIKKIGLSDKRIKIIEVGNNPIRVVSINFTPDIIVDAIFGTGFKGAPQGIFQKAIEMINQIPAYKVAVDIPSGVNGDTGVVEGSAVKGNLTITMGLLKRGHLLYPGKEYCGVVKVTNIGITYESLSNNTFLLDQEFIRNNLPKRKPNGHKGTFGSVIVVAGGKGYSGAACLTSLGALVSGAGLVRLCFPENINVAVEKKLTEVIKMPLPVTKEGTLALSSFNKIKDIIEKSTVMAIGPGVTTNPETKELIGKIIKSFDLPMVIDADGLNNLTISFLLKLSKQKRQNIILTPHPGEFERLIGIPVKTINRNRIDIVREWSKKLSMTIVLKGAPTIIGSQEGNIYINPTGNSGLAKGGSGDVLTGLIAGLIAQGTTSINAASIGVYLHGYAADIAVKDKTEYSLIASDLIKMLPKAIMKIIQNAK